MKKGGKVIASGGFGCVFKPSLKCKGKNRENGKITKLMTEKHALSEYNEIKLIKNKLDSIPNYKNYFMIDDFQICIPDKLDNSDLKDYKKMMLVSLKTKESFLYFYNINRNRMIFFTNDVEDYEMLNTDFKFVLITSSKFSSDIRISNPSLVIPALFTTISMLPKSAIICVISSSAALKSAASERYPLAFTPKAFSSFSNSIPFSTEER